MRVLLDTNVPIAAFVAKGAAACTGLFEHSARDRTMVTSSALLAELDVALRRKFGAAACDANTAVALPRRRFERTHGRRYLPGGQDLPTR